ncbi:putative protein kinase RLK-Pelle-CrRLK1L-1 family [Helianthus annuus]|nr:putative protein kinase RLK-Pelle-CrRLK1L-1 family [Helianthus annuus]
MESFMKDFEHLKIQLEDIKSATNNFDKTKVIGFGGFGKVYEGELSHIKGRGMVAIKRLDSKSMQGNNEFWKEIMLLSRYSHQNLISLLGFCDEGSEKILVYEHASRRSLDRHLCSTDLPWMQRIKICLDAAKGLSYLHDDKGTQQRVLHRDIKSSNILLDENWNAKVSDMGLSRIGAANQQHTAQITNVVGTIGYWDPLYLEAGLLTKESDVYSFGVLLFEVLCGRLCFKNTDAGIEILVRMWKESYEQNKLQEIIFHDMKQHMDPSSLGTYSDIAFKCLQKSREERPTMPHVVEKLALALKYQEIFELLQLPKDYKEMLMTAPAPLNYRSESELKMLLLKGVLLNGGKTFFSLNMSGHHCEMISIAECLSETQHYISCSECNSRFAKGCYEPLGKKFKTSVRTQFLSPSITYTVNLVFKNKKAKERYVGLEYKLEGQKHKSYSFVSDEREDGWLTAELYQFTSDQRNVDLEILFYTKWCPTILVEGIEFCPMEKVEHEVLRDENVDMRSISDSETYWEQKLPTDYEDIIKWSKDGVQWRTKKELYYILHKGLLIKDGEEWFSLTKDGKKCLMLPAIAVLEENKWEWKSLPKTRFEEVADGISDKFDIYCKFRPKMLSLQTTYATYLVYKLPDGYKHLPAPVQVVDENSDLKEVYNIFLSTPRTPVITRNVMIKKTYSPSIRPIIKGLPKLRSDGWMEVHVFEFQTLTTIKMISVHLQLSSYDKVLSKGIIVQGLEFRPI